MSDLNGPAGGTSKGRLQSGRQIIGKPLKKGVCFFLSIGIKALISQKQGVRVDTRTAQDTDHAFIPFRIQAKPFAVLRSGSMK